MKPRIPRALACAALMLAFALLLGGCTNMLQSLMGGSGSEASSASVPEASSSSRAGDSPTSQKSTSRIPKVINTPDVPLPAVSAGAAESEEAQETPDAWDEYTNNTYVQVTDQTSGDYLPSIVLMPGGVFLFTANLYDGMGHVWGYYAPMAGGGLECRVEKRDFAGFIGDDAEAFSIDFIDGQKFTYNGPTIGMTENGDTFAFSHSEPAVEGSIPDVLATVTADGDGGLNLREGPGISYESYGLIPKGSLLEVLSMTKNYNDGEVWYHVRFGAQTGWVAAQYTIFVSQNTY